MTRAGKEVRQERGLCQVSGSRPELSAGRGLQVQVKVQRSSELEIERKKCQGQKDVQTNSKQQEEKMSRFKDVQNKSDQEERASSGKDIERKNCQGNTIPRDDAVNGRDNKAVSRRSYRLSFVFIDISTSRLETSVARLGSTGII